ncbi:hypothetical protein F5Y11DRAFT_365368 [Daldinia sp. FL1419]|nr:hypothetical protein F5Y11DRAFT_365368 [Daldinia sp. FL1419]
MEYAPQRTPGQPFHFEAERALQHPRTSVTHNYPELKNFRFGHQASPSEEHRLVPIVKLTNFSRATLNMRLVERLSGIIRSKARTRAHCINVRNMAQALIALACNTMPESQAVTSESHPYKLTFALRRENNPTQPIPDEEIQTHASPAFFDIPGLDPILKDAVAQCLAHEDESIPTSRQLRDTILQGARMVTWGRTMRENPGHLRQSESTDTGNAEFVQEYILDAEAGPSRR